jgi:ubiquinone biosynthesis protein Coq4
MAQKLKLSDKEISALAKKVLEKRNKERRAKVEAAAKLKVADAKKYIDALNKLPPEVVDYIYNNRWSRSKISPLDRAKMMVSKDHGEYTDSERSVAFEADVTLAAHDCTTLTQLCRKLGI